MTSVRFALPSKGYKELQSSYNYLGSHSAHSYKAKKNRNVLS